MCYILQNCVILDIGGNNSISDLVSIKFDDLGSITMGTSDISKGSSNNRIITEVESMASVITEELPVSADNRVEISANNIKKEQQTCLDQLNFNDIFHPIQQSTQTNDLASMSGEINCCLIWECCL